MVSLKDVNWGAALVGAGLVVGILALSAAPAAIGGASMLGALAGQVGLSNTVTGAVAGLAGAAAGHKVANLFHRVQDASTTLVGR